MKKVAFYTLGCKVNQYETGAMAEAFEKAGYTVVGFDEAADVYIINTCTVTGLSSRKSRQAIRRARQLNGSAIVAAVGCYPQTAKEELEKMPEVDIIVGTAERERMPGYVEAYMSGAAGGKDKLTVIGDIMKKRGFDGFKAGNRRDRTRALLKVQDGCSRFCSYCIIPYARGPNRSRPAAEVADEAKRLADAGFKEIVLTGIHLASYGKDLGQVRLMDLVALVGEVDGIERIRLGSLEPAIITREFVDAAASIRKLCPHYHVSLQSGCDDTLRRMNRHYTTEEYLESVELLRSCIPDVAIATDVMVGFPGETDEEFEKTFSFLEKVRFSKMHVFKFSPRKGTPAASMQGQVGDAVKEARSKRVIELSDICAREFEGGYIGSAMPVLYEREEMKGSGIFEGLTANYIRVLAKGNNSLEGNIKETRLVRLENGYVLGEILKSE